MKQLSRLTIALFACIGLAITAVAGPEALPSGKEMKEVAPPPPPCNWTGFYFGIHGGGQFGHSEDRDIDGYQGLVGSEWGYDESGAVAGGQIGYNWQWNWLVLGPEIDLGYMNLDGSGVSRYDTLNYASDTHGSTSSDLYMTFRGRVGFALDKWLIYATGGGIAVNYDTSVIDDRDVPPAGDELLDAHAKELNWGWTVGGGVERMIGCHWSVKTEYLFFDLGDQGFSGVGVNGGHTFHFTGIGTEGHIIRAGLNYKF
jgi:outer membrane immunogenic protein